MDAEDEKRGVSRRNFLGWMVGAVMTFIGTVVGVTGLGSVLSPALKSKEKAEWVRLGAVDSFTLGEPKKVDFVQFVKDGWIETRKPRTVWTVREKGDEFTVYNTRCTHLGCAVDWKEGSQGKAFYSPCHGGVFTLEGRVIAGPPPRPLDTLRYRVQDGALYAEYMDFVVGIPEKKPV